MESPAPTLVDPRRSAHASIRGHLYQACLAAQRWLELGPEEVLLCEGLHRRLLEEGLRVSEQVKLRTGRLDEAVLAGSLRSFLLAYVPLTRAGERRRIVFTTTAPRRRWLDWESGVDLLARWEERPLSPEVVAGLRRRLRRSDGEPGEPVAQALAWLDDEPGRWEAFCQAVEWRFGATDLPGVRAAVAGLLSRRPETQVLAELELLVDLLVAQVFEVSSRPEPADRLLTREGLAELLGGVREELGTWAGSPPARRLRQAFDELAALGRLLEPRVWELPRPAPGRPAGLAPGRLLTAAYEVVPFEEEARREELAALADWCNGEAPRSVWLLTGEGGAGKTRLLIETCRRLRGEGWEAGFLHSDCEAWDRQDLLAGTIPRLAVVNHAEARLELLRPLLREMKSAPESARMRLVLLSRRAGDWWPALQREEVIEDVILMGPEPKGLTPLLVGAEAQEAAFRRAVAIFAATLGCPVPEGVMSASAASAPSPPVDLAAPEMDRALYLHMAALAAVLGRPVESAGDLLLQTLDHERRFWRGEIRNLHWQHGAVPADLEERLTTAVAAFTLAGGAASRDEACHLLHGAVGPLPRCGLTSLLGLLRPLYRGQGNGPFLEGLQPDLLGEELVAQVLTSDPELPGRILDAAGEDAHRQILTVLTRLAQRLEDGESWLAGALTGRLAALAEAALKVAVETGDPPWTAPWT